MKNLNVRTSREFHLNKSIVGQCFDTDNNIIFVLTEEFEIFRAQISDENQVRIDQLKIESDQIQSIKLTRDNVKLLEFVVELNGVLIVLEDGSVYTLEAITLDPCHSGRCIYRHKYEISHVSLSPGQDLIALADEENDIHIMSIDCTILHSSNALTQNDSLHKPVGVGWGSKETQFFGLDGRPSKEGKKDAEVILNGEELEFIEKIELSDFFQKFSKSHQIATVIDWRGDGQFLASLTYIPSSGKHYLKVWNRNLELQYMSDQLTTVERGILSWVPDGKYICCAQRRHQRINEIAMFEKNGMVHQRLTLPMLLKDLYINDITWSIDSKIFAILATQFYEKNDEVRHTSILMLYTMQNFHYYLKFTTTLAENCDHSVKWDPINSSKLWVISSIGKITEYDCNFGITYSNSYSTVAVVDGNRILVTPMKLCNQPPPMSAIKIETDSIVQRLILNPYLDCRTLAFTTLDSRLVYFPFKYRDPDSIKDSDTKLSNYEAIDLSPANGPSVKLQICSKAASKAIEVYDNFKCAQIDDLSNYEQIVSTNDGLIATKSTHDQSSILKIELSADGKPAIETLKTIQGLRVISMATRGDVFGYILSDFSAFIEGRPDPVQLIECSPNCSKLSVIHSEIVNQDAFIYLSSDLSLRYNREVITSNSCTSFRVTRAYLVYTTTDDHMHFVLLESLSDFTNRIIDSCSQPIENGGTLVLVDEEDSKVVLQMPRGNLETLHPRVLILNKVVNLLNSGSYVKSIKLARRHKLDLNLISDCLLRFDNGSQKLQSFVSAVADYDPSLVSLFITSLQNNDTIKDRYIMQLKCLSEQTLRNELQKDLPSETISNKINLICSTIVIPNLPKFTEQTILCLLVQQPRKTEDVLRLIFDLDEKSKQSALKFVSYFIDIDNLFYSALRTYNTDIAFMVAEKSNKDPKEYLSLLDRFTNIDDKNLQRYEIAMYVKDYEIALNHLLQLIISSKAENNLKNQFIELTTDKRLYSSALLALSKENDLTDVTEAIWLKYASYLLEKRYYLEAGLSFSKAFSTSSKLEHLESALKCYRMAENGWQQSALVIARSTFDISVKQALFDKLFRHLVQNGYSVESIAMLSHGTSIKDRDLVQELVKKGAWYMAEFIAESEFRKKLLVIIAADIIDVIENQLEVWRAEYNINVLHFKRLKELIEARHSQRLNDMKKDNHISDTLSTIADSEISSALSGSVIQKPARSGAASIKTRSSVKSNQSQNFKAKRLNLKKGSRYEDLALIMELKKYMTKQKTLHEEATRYVGAMFEYCSFELAKNRMQAIQTVLQEALQFSRSTLDLLWPCSELREQKYSIYKHYLNFNETFDNIDTVDLQILIRPEIPKEVICFTL